MTVLYKPETGLTSEANIIYALNVKSQRSTTWSDLKKVQLVFNNIKKSRYYFIIIHHPSISRHFIRDAEALRAKQKVHKRFMGQDGWA